MFYNILFCSKVDKQILEFSKWQMFSVKNHEFKINERAGEMAQWVRASDCSSKGPEFKSQQPHGGSQPSVTRSDSLFWCV